MINVLHESEKESSEGRHGAGVVFLEASQGFGADRDRAQRNCLKCSQG